MRKGFSGVLSTALAILVVTGCTPDLGGGPGRGDQSEVPAGSVDPQVFQDVVDSVLMLPGPTQRRAVRVSNYTRNLMFEACDEPGIPLNSTADRFMQQYFPDLELIREKGLVEPTSTKDAGPHCDIVSSGVEAKLPSRVDANELIEPWLDQVNTTMQDSSLTELKQPMRECMIEKTSLSVGADVPTAFLQAANIGLSDDEGDDDADMEAWSVAFADCAAPYFDRLRDMLAKERPAVVERNREVLNRYAQELIATGYVP